MDVNLALFNKALKAGKGKQKTVALQRQHYDVRMYNISFQIPSSLLEMKLNSLSKFDHAEQCVNRSRSANDTGAEEKVSWCKVILNVFTEGLLSLKNGPKCSR